MDEVSLGHFRKLLLLQQKALQVLGKTVEESVAVVELDQSSVGRLSRMDALQGQAMSQERQRRRDIEMQKIAAALGRIDANEFGDCLDCGEPIAYRRLELDPAATLCIECASAREQV